MEVSFYNQHIEDLCCKPKVAIKKLGAPSAKALEKRLAQLFAAQNVLELVAGRPHPLKGNRLGEYALDLHAGDRMVMISAVSPVPMLPNGGIDWRSVTHVQVIEIGDYHD
jgi:proteic killer suppression protein